MNTITVRLKDQIGTINPHIYGHFVEHIGGVVYDGIWVGPDSDIPNDNGIRLDIVNSLKKIRPSIIRWPGGCFAETYHWQDGIGPAGKRPARGGWWHPLDGRVESNQFGSHEFVRFCRLVGAEPYLAAGVAAVTPMEIRDWVEYCNFPRGSTALAREREFNGSPEPFNVKYWGIGNENWGFGGNYTPEGYCDEYRRFGTIVGGLGLSAFLNSSINANIVRQEMNLIACGPNGDDYAWTERFFSHWSDDALKRLTRMYGYALHYYCGTAGTATEFTEDQWYELVASALRMGELIDGHRKIMDRADPSREIQIVVDEWGTWHPIGSGPTRNAYQFEQQATMRDAVVAALTLNIFNNRADFVAMSNIAQLVNCLQSLYLISGSSFVETANYHVFDLFKGHQGATALRTDLECDSIEFKSKDGPRSVERLSCSASLADGLIRITVANLDVTASAQVRIAVPDAKKPRVTRRVDLHAADPHAFNEASHPDRIVPREIDLASATELTVELPPASVVLLEVAP